MHIAVHLRRYAAGRIGGQENIVRHLVEALVERPLAADQRVTLLGRAAEADGLRELAPAAELALIADDADEREVHRTLVDRGVDLLVGALMQVEPALPPVPSVILIPDLQHEYLPENFSPAELDGRLREYRPGALHARLVITISDHARRSIIERYGVDPERVRVIPPAADVEFRPEPDPDAARALDRLGLSDELVYYPADFWPHKNHETLFEAIERLGARGRPLQLVLTGSPDSGYTRLERRVAGLPNVRYLGRLPRPEVAELMRRARALVFPSRFEGFGIPMVEAFSCGTPVVASNAASCPEVAGGAALLVDPHDPEALADAIEKAARHEPTREELRRRGFERARDFCWERSRQALRAALLEVRALPPAAGPPKAVEWLGPTSVEAARLAAEAPGVGAILGGAGPRGTAVSRSELIARPEAARLSRAMLRADVVAELGGLPAAGDPAAEYRFWLRLTDRYPAVRLGADLGKDPKPLRFDAEACRRAVEAIEQRGVAPPYEWRLRQARARLGAAAPGFLVALWALVIGLRESPGRRRAYFAEWRRRTGVLAGL